MPLRKSLILRLFSILFVLTLGILILAGFSIFWFAQHVVGGEFLRLNQATLRQQAAAIGSDLSELRAYGERIAINGRLNELLLMPPEIGAKAAKSLLNDINNEYISSRLNANTLMDIYVLGTNGANLSVYNTPGFDWETIRTDERLAPLLQGEKDMLMLPTVHNEAGRGVLTYSYQMVFAMKPAYSTTQRDVRGLVIFDISEITLFGSYRAFQKNNIVMNAIDAEGRILSGQDKRLITEAYDYTPAVLDKTARNDSVMRRILNGQFYLYERIVGTEWLLVQRIPAAIAFEPLSELFIAILLIIAVFGACMLAAFIYTAQRALKPVMRIKDKMEQFIAGDLTVRIHMEKDDEFSRIQEAFNSMVAQTELLIAAVETREKEKRVAELDFLQAQINPHFIYNTLTSIRFMLEMNKAAEAGEMVFYFSKLLRQTLSRADEFVTLEAEMETLKNYIGLQTLRYKDVFKVEYEVEEQVLPITLPTLLLQPVVENAIFHAATHGKITIRICARRAGDTLHITIADDGVGMSSKQRETVLQKELPINSVGLRNVQERIQLNYGMEYGLTITETEGGGTTVTFLLPCIQAGKAEERGKEVS